MAPNPEAIEPDDVDWNAIWAALQELGATLAPFGDDLPRGLRTLRSGMDIAEPMVERRCFARENADA